MKKIRSGQAYLYRDGGIDSTVLEVQMKDRVRGDYLRRALDQAMIRYPYLKSKLVERNGDFYIADNPLSLAFAKTQKFRALGSMKVNYHLVDVTYTENKIRVAFHHALCDGRGIMPFVQTLVYYYCCLKYNKTFDATGIRLAGEPLRYGETDEPYGDDKYEVANSSMPEIVKDGYALPEHQDEVTTFYRYAINISQESFMSVAKDNNATPAILVSLLASKAIKRLYPDADKPVVCSMASDMRKELGHDHTHKNCVGSLYLPYTESLEQMSLKEQATLYRQIMKEQKHPDVVKRSVNGHIGMSDRLDQLQGFEAKKEMMSFFKNLCINTFVISYVGQLAIGECERYVDSMHLYSSGTKGLILNMTSAGQCITVDILQSFQSEAFAHEFMSILDEMGMVYTATNKMEFSTTSDRTFATGKWQAERYYGVFEG